MAIRLQRKRTRGWRMPEGAVYVGRPSKWGNPWTAKHQGSASKAVALYREWLLSRQAGIDSSQRRFDGPYIADAALELRGKDLACWCPIGQPCHADVLLEFANAELGEAKHG